MFFQSSEINMLGKKVLLIDDDPDFLHLTSLTFEKYGAQVITAPNGMEGVSKAFAHRPNLIILDVMMPGMSGFEVCQKIRQFTTAPIIFITALDQEHDMLQGLDAGADGFLTKPFNAKILMARAKSVLRRSEHGDNNQPVFNYSDGRLRINFERRSVEVNERQIDLTPVEFRLLVYLASNPDKVLTFDQILINVWGDEYKGSKDYVHVYISHLRRKIEEDTKEPRYILSVHGVGYIFERQNFVWATAGKYSDVPFSISEHANNFNH